MNIAADPEAAPCTVHFSRTSPNRLLIQLEGLWKIGNPLPSIVDVENAIESESGIRTVSFDSQKILGWDSGLVAFLTKVSDLCSQRSIEVDRQGLPEGVKRLLALAAVAPGHREDGSKKEHAGILSEIGGRVTAFFYSLMEMLEFLGETTVACVRLMVGKAHFRKSDFTLIIQECGVQALPIVSLISLLVGMILAFVGAVQLMMFGAQIYVAGLVGIAMVRVMGAIMTGIIMAGRTGAAFAAQLGTMQVNEEIDAFRTMGISPIEFLVLPRMISLCLMMPLLCLYADLMGILGGLIVGVGMMNLNVVEYYNMTRASVGLDDFWVGLFQSSVFGVLVALSGCMRGMQCGRSAAAVGEATTSAVVTGIVSIIVATAVITVMCNVLGI